MQDCDFEEGCRCVNEEVDGEHSYHQETLREEAAFWEQAGKEAENYTPRGVVNAATAKSRMCMVKASSGEARLRAR